MKTSNIIGLSILTLVLLTCLPSLVHAQLPTDPGNPDAPIDGGISLLVAAGIGYGVKKVRENRKKKQEAIKD